MTDTIRILPSKGFDYTNTTDPSVSVNPPTTLVTWLNATSGVIFVCTDNTAGANVWALQGRELLTADRTYYVSTTGSDSNDGLTSGSPFATIGKAYSTALMLDLGGYQVTAQLAAGTYSESFTPTDPLVGGTFRVTGDLTTPTNVVWGAGTSNTFRNDSTGTTMYVGGIDFDAGGSAGTALRADGGGSKIIIDGTCYFGSFTGGHHLFCSGGGVIRIADDITVNGGAGYCIRCASGGTLQNAAGTTMTFSGTPAFTACAFVELTGIIQVYSLTISGSTTGQRYSAVLNGVINTYGGGATYFPGDSAGSTATGGQYA